MIPILTSCEITKRNLWLDTDIADDLIEEACVQVQRTFVQATLGWNYWNSIYETFVASGSTGYTAADSYILDNFIYDVIAYGVAYELVPSLYVQLKSDGPRIVTSSQSMIAPDKMISFDQQRWQNKIDERRTGMYLYMNNHRSSYPIYFSEHAAEKNLVNFPVHRAGRRGGGWSYSWGRSW